MKTRTAHLHSALALLVLCPCLCLVEPAAAQSAPAQSAPYRPDQAGVMNREELANFEGFLNSHPEVAEQLRRDPSLVDKQGFLKDHPALETYLNDHPAIRERIEQNPAAFMSDEERFERGNDDRGRGSDTKRQELANFDRFLDSHPEVAQQLRRDPSLVDKQGFLKDHPALGTYLRDHPAIRQQMEQHPDAFMADEDRFDRGNDDRGGSTDVNRDELANFNRFLDSHPEVAQQVRRDPSLVDQQDFLKEHPALGTYLQDHPAVRDEIHQDSNGFTQQEARLEHPNGDVDRDALHRHFGQFLNAHPDLAQQIAERPSQVNDQEFLDSHPELQQYLNQNPDVQHELTADPDTFVKSCQPFTNTNGQTMKTTTSTAKPKPNQ